MEHYRWNEWGSLPVKRDDHGVAIAGEREVRVTSSTCQVRPGRNFSMVKDMLYVFFRLQKYE